MKIRDVLKRKGGAVETVDAADSLGAAIERFVNSKIRALVVTEEGKVVGILALRDVLARIERKGGAAIEESVRAAMTADVVSGDPDTTLEEVHGMFASEGINHLPVVEGGELVGIVTPVDVLADHVKDLDHQRELLHAYITNSVL